MKIPETRDLELLELSKRSVRSFFKHDMTTYAAALAYRSLFAIIPFLALLVALLGFLGIGSFFDWLTDQTSSALQGKYAELAAQSISQTLH
jgi:membrane protein